MVAVVATVVSFVVVLELVVEMVRVALAFATVVVAAMVVLWRSQQRW